MSKEFYNVVESDTERDKKKYSYSINEAHDVLSNSIVLIGSKIDSFFGQNRGDDLANGSRIRMWTETTKVEGEKLNTEANIRFKIHLPYTQKRFKIVFEKKADDPAQDNPENTPHDDSGNTGDNKSGKISSKGKTTAALQYIVDSTRNWNFFATTGIRVDIPPEPFARARVRRNWKLPYDVEMIAEQSVFWFLEDGFGETSSLDFDYKVSPNKLFRFSNNATWRDETDTFTIIHGPSFFHTFSPRRGISYHAKAVGSSRPKSMITNYDLTITYRQLLHKTWFFYELSPKGTFPRDEQWKFTPSISLKFEVVIGRN
ncbi:MAG: hypothetical protein KC493_00770 [Bacteriovoracaceae bacterium]|nr:hypothetical protein [Bacteriovoracaceae bacterium]